ncbi:MAG: leucine-rich repeat domain-containing protein [Alphaproteobacteria bacterium]|nr:leucine-rich repeat domain-containing protein [Alphaproteobacteria bacterium]
MKYKIEFYLAALFLALSLNSSAMAGRTLDGTKVVSDEDIEWLADEGYVSTSKFVQQVHELDPEEREEVETLNLQSALLGSSGLKIIADDLLPYLPNLKLLNLYGSQLRSREDLVLLASILDRFNSLQYVDIDGNGIATQTLSFVKEYEAEGQEELAKKFQKKVVFSCKTLLKNQFPGADREKYDEWYQTHASFYVSPLRTLTY